MGYNVTKGKRLMQSLASSVHGVVAEMRQIHMDYWTTESCGGKGMAWPLSQGENALTLALTGFIDLICIGILGVYIKLINHCQAVTIKQ